MGCGRLRGEGRAVGRDGYNSPSLSRNLSGVKDVGTGQWPSTGCQSPSRERVASAQAGNQVSHIRGVPDMEKVQMRMNPMVLDWSWRYWTWKFSVFCSCKYCCNQ